MIEFEHTLFMLLLLISLLNAKPPQQRWALGLVLVGILLAFIPPARSLQIPWNILLGLVIPLILWQNIRRLLVAQWQIGRYELLLWGGTALIFGITFALSNDLNWLGAFSFGIIAASMIWRAAESDQTSSFISQIGPLTMIILLGEVEPVVVTPDYYLGSIFSGVFFGLVIAFLSAYGYRRYTGKMREWIIILQIYLAYWVAALVGVSSVAAAITSVIVFTTIGLRESFWDDEATFLAPLNSWVGFGALLSLFVFLGWQSHLPLTPILILETVMGTIIAVAAAGIGRWLKIPAFSDLSLWRVGLRISLFLFPAFLLWPRGTLHQPLQLAVALGLAWLVIYVASRTLPEFLENYGGEN